MSANQSMESNFARLAERKSMPTISTDIDRYQPYVYEKWRNQKFSGRSQSHTRTLSSIRILFRTHHKYCIWYLCVLWRKKMLEQIDIWWLHSITNNNILYSSEINYGYFSRKNVNAKKLLKFSWINVEVFFVTQSTLIKFKLTSDQMGFNRKFPSNVYMK